MDLFLSRNTKGWKVYRDLPPFVAHNIVRTIAADIFNVKP